MKRANKLAVVGIGYRPLGARARELVRSTDVILTSSRLFEVFKQYEDYEAVKDRIKVINKVPDTVAFIRERLSRPAVQPVVLLASGDPLFFGIGRKMREEFGTEGVEVLPDLSSVQEAFARINEAWDDAFFISLHGGPDIAKRRKLPVEMKDIPALLDQHEKIGILTDKTNNPTEIAKVLHSAWSLPSNDSIGGNPQSEIRMHVCERLGYSDEKITTGTPGELAERTFSDPNVVIIQKSEVRGQEPEDGRQKPALERISRGTEARFGLREEEFIHERGLITKDEVRAVTLHKLRLPQHGVLWDIGAGSGSVSLEAARLCPGLRVFAVEKDTNRIDAIRANRERLNAGNVEIVEGFAPDALKDLPAPDRVFIGGSGGALSDVLALVNGKMPSGIVVVNSTTLETLNDALTGLEDNGFPAEVSEISISRSKIVAGKRHMSALNPVFILKGEKG